MGDRAGMVIRVVPHITHRRSAVMAKKRIPEPKLIRPDDIDPHHNWARPLQARVEECGK